MLLSEHFIDTEGRVLVYQMEKSQLTKFMKFASEARLSQLFQFGNTEPTCFYATIWTLYGHWGSVTVNTGH